MNANEIFNLALGFFALILGGIFFVYQESRKLATEVQEDLTGTLNVVLAANMAKPDQVAEIVGAIHRSFRGASCLYNLVGQALLQLFVTIIIRYLNGFASSSAAQSPSEVIKLLEFLSWANLLISLVMIYRVFRSRRPDLFDRTGWM